MSTIELTTGPVSCSMGLVADSLDMLADSFVYGLGLWVVGSKQTVKKRYKAEWVFINIPGIIRMLK